MLGINVTEFYALRLAEVDFGTFYISVHIYSKHRTSREGLEVLSFGKCFCKH